MGSDMVRASAVAAAAFEETLEDLGFGEADEPEFGDPGRLGRRAALLVAADAVWRRHLGPLLDGKQVQELLGVRTRQAISDLVKRHRLLGLPTQNRRTVFPAFQFVAGRPHPALPAILSAFAEADVGPYTVASWFVTPQPLLEQETAAAWLRLGRDGERLKEAARRSAARLGQ
jgi:hypothetical protein